MPAGLQVPNGHGGHGMSRRWCARRGLDGVGEPRGGAECVVDGGAGEDEVRFDGIADPGQLVVDRVETGDIAIVVGIGFRHGFGWLMVDGVMIGSDGHLSAGGEA